MIILKYTKTDIFAYLSFLDIRNAFKRTMNRAKITTKMSQGFNPHELVYFNDPDSLGIASKADYALIDTELEPNIVMEQFNLNAPDGLKIEKIANVNTKINFNKIFKYALYKVDFENQINEKEVLSIFDKAEIKIEKKSKNEIKIVNIKPKIEKIEIKTDKSVNLLLSYGQEKINPFLITDYICDKLNLNKNSVQVVKEQVFDEKKLNVDEIFFN